MRYLIVTVVVAAALIGVIFAVHWWVVAPAYDHGKLAATQALQPQIADLSRQLTDALNANATFQAASDAAAERAAMALAQEATRTATNAAEIKRLAAVVARTRSTEAKTVVCQRADALLDSIIEREMR